MSAGPSPSDVAAEVEHVAEAVAPAVSTATKGMSSTTKTVAGTGIGAVVLSLIGGAIGWCNNVQQNQATSSAKLILIEQTLTEMRQDVKDGLKAIADDFSRRMDRQDTRLDRFGERLDRASAKPGGGE